MKTYLLSAVAALALLAAAFGCAGNKDLVQSDIQREITSRQAGFAECYRVALEKNRGLSGSMTLNFQIPAGTQQAGPVAASGDIADEGLKACVVGKAGGVRVSEPFHRDIAVSYPLSFTPQF